MITYQDVVAARERIKEYIYKTPLELSMGLSSENCIVYLKLECQQKLKSFKVRGALSKMTLLSEEEKKKGILAVSSGNHGAGVSYSSYILGGIKAKIYVPRTTPGAKLDKMRYYGAEVILEGDNYDAAHEAALEALKREGLTFVDPCSDADVIAGAGTVALEILEQNPDIDTIVVPIGGGGLITGVGVAAKSLKPGIKVIGVQTAACPAMIHSMRDKRCYEAYPNEPSICEALVGGVGEIPYEMSSRCIDQIIEVDEGEIRNAVVYLLDKEKVVSEPSGAVGVAAFMSNPEIFKNRKTAFIITGGNLDSKLMKAILNENMK
jgi:threonine dehydratase